MKCEYQVWDKQKKRMTVCGQLAEQVTYPVDIPGVNERLPSCSVALCPEHREFVRDCLRTDYDIARKVKSTRKTITSKEDQ